MDAPRRDIATPPPPLDTLRLRETPEGIDLGLRVAGPVPRALALALDLLIRLGLYLLLLPLLALADLGVGLALLAVFAIEWFYPVVFEVWRGATPGKRALGLRVVHEDATPVGLPASTLRNLLRTVDFLPAGYALGLVVSLADPDFRRIGDLAAATLVVHDERQATRRGRVSTTGQRPPPEFDATTRAAILAFAERAPALADARRIELAEVLTAPRGVHSGAAPALITAWAAWIDPDATDGRAA
ncbi:RDD family protein [Marichromatium gracile]|uniref:Transporter n=1 Tax=Marichromatium gracile TaxID=1048 RepID=A0ABR5VKA9_MARGR|nr:RDD family protein [Marichromatium gracile]KXX66019.1 transporter [Marichromatium gracile]